MQNIYRLTLSIFLGFSLILFSNRVQAGEEVIYVNSPNVIVDLSVLDDISIEEGPVKLTPPARIKGSAKKVKNQERKEVSDKRARTKKKVYPKNVSKPDILEISTGTDTVERVSPESSEGTVEAGSAVVLGGDAAPVPRVSKTEPVEVKEEGSKEEKGNKESVSKDFLDSNISKSEEVRDNTLEKKEVKQDSGKEDSSTFSDSGDLLVLEFSSDATILSSENESKLKTLASRLKSNETISVRIMSYARDEESGSSKARRQSLSRALAARSVLLDEGVRSTRIEVRALGNKVQEDKIYLEIIERK